MPKRSNDFQRLLYLIHHQIDNNAKVTESKFLFDHAANIDREVDIVIEKEVGDSPIIVGVECQGRGRIATVEWVEQMIAKHQTLPTNKLILVAQSGFTGSALKKARMTKVEALTLSQAIKKNWTLVAGKDKITISKLPLKTITCSALLVSSEDQYQSIDLKENQLVYDGKREELGNVHGLISTLLDFHLDDVSEMWTKKNSKKEDVDFLNMEFDLPKDTYITDSAGTMQEISKLFVVSQCSEEREDIDLQNKSFRTSQIAFGKTKTLDANALISVVEHEDKPNTAAILISTDKKSPTKIINLREARTARKETQ